MKVRGLTVSGKWMTFVGAFLFCLVNGFGWYYGNLYVYLTSFILRYQAASPYVLSQWTISIYLIATNLGYLASGVGLEFMSKRIVLSVGMLLADIGYMAAYFAMRQSMTALNVTLGFIQGLGNGITNALGVQFAAEWAGKDVGLMIALIHSGMNVGAIVGNQFLTLYINPDHEKPDATVEMFRFFSQDNVVDNVPSALLILACAKLIISFVGFLMIRVEPEAEHKTDQNASTTYDSTRSCEERVRPNEAISDAVTSREKITDASERANGECLPQNEAVQASERQTKDYTLREAIQTKEFHLILLVLMVSETMTLIISNYYKVFGQEYIHDDYFLTLIGSLTGVAVIAGKLLWGRIMDAYGIKNCLVILLSIWPPIMAFYFFIPLLNKWIFLVSTLCIYGCCAMHSVFGGFMVKLFGKTHLAKIFGCLVLASCVLLVVLPRVMEELTLGLGWFALFCLPAALGATSLALVVLFFPSGI